MFAVCLWCGMRGDAGWGGEKDVAFFGEGRRRQQWQSYRDGIVYYWVVKKAPLFPISALMLHGIVASVGPQ